MSAPLLLVGAIGLAACAGFIRYARVRQGKTGDAPPPDVQTERDAYLSLALEGRLPLKAALVQLRRICDAPSDAGTARAARMAHLSVTAALDQLEDLNDLLRLERGPVPTVLQPVDLQEVILDTTKAHRLEAERKRVAIEFAPLHEGLDRIAADRELLAKGVDKLIGFALARTQVGHVLIELLRVSPRGEPAVRIAVSDTGPAISADQLAMAFDPRAPFGATPGHRLDLPLCHVIAKALGGQLTGIARPGEGACFRLDIPHRSAGPAPADPQGDEAAHRQERAKILLVQEPSIDRELIAAMIERCGHQAICADSEVHARARMDKDPDLALALVDDRLPGAITWLKQRVRETDVSAARLPIIAITSASRPPNGTEIQGYLVRPVSFADLSRLFSKWLAGQQRSGGMIVPFAPIRARDATTALEARWQKRRAAAMAAVSELTAEPLPPPERCRETAVLLHHVAMSAKLFGEERLGSSADRLERLLRHGAADGTAIMSEARRLLANVDNGDAAAAGPVRQDRDV